MNSRPVRILNTIGEEFAAGGKAILGQIGHVDYRIPTQLELPAVIADYDAALIGLGLVFNEPVLAAAQRLKFIATATTGLDHVNVELAEQRGIEVLSLRGEDAFLNTITGTAELTLGLMIDIVRRTPWAFDAVKQHQWDREKFKGISLYGKTLGLIGLGRLGTMMARYAHALGMQVIFFDPNKFAAPPYSKVTWNELLERSDVISIHVHLTAETENLLGADAIRRIKPGAFLVNTARGKIVDEHALLQALQSGRLAGYATDVLSDELSFSNARFDQHPLVDYAKTHQNVVIVPHIGGMTIDSRNATDEFIARKLVARLTAFFDVRPAAS